MAGWKVIVKVRGGSDEEWDTEWYNISQEKAIYIAGVMNATSEGVELQFCAIQME